MFRRADVMWMVFDTETPLDTEALKPQPNGLIRSVSVAHEDAHVIRLKLDRPRLGGLAIEGTGWAVTIGDSVADPGQPIQLTRTIVGPNRASIIIPFDGAQRVHRIANPDVGTLCS